MNKYLIWILIASFLGLGGFSYYKIRQNNRVILELRQELKAANDSTYAIVKDLQSSNSKLSKEIRALSEMVITLTPDSSVGLIDTIVLTPNSTNVGFSGENYLFTYTGNIELQNNSSLHKLSFTPKPISIKQSLMQDPQGNWYSIVESANPKVGINSRFFIDKSLLFSTNTEVIKPKNFQILPFVYIRKEWDGGRINFDAGIQATFYSSFFRLSAREIGLGTYLKFLTF